MLDDGQKLKPTSDSGFLDPKREESDLEHGSTRAPSTVPDGDYEKQKGSDAESHEEKPHNAEAVEEPNSDEVKPQEYPQGINFVFIVFALIMSIFLVSLDMVSTPLATPGI